ncbi:TetR/AcrR family transcriptional regulator C-terminal domain-containing protein [Streptomyces clavuligerus]|nr:TetR/AcrR family transcriptional regulator C-terminal domain-containing protein [Streptomyces clavuligerus]ANW22247.1 TetR family transcriptional regulator [Streptomyces clavuligerus]AXU17142.1 TetR/AcrR family transcriptional regulator [Streptomyces clavuligerus]MBY6307211.1 TetR/AcrR family transcriptional regulator C-terminal domain-containing protein [Streptomyces clavuligerus]QCS10210.1 TetR/AcrR family transcriptional regulator [Streptomyces clavuligerus]QPJ97743.1 TetR family transcr
MVGESDGGGTWLPASVEAAWGLRERPAKGPRPGLSIDRIVASAVAVASAEGLGAVSMGRVAKELGVSTMSLYRYVAAKDELYVLMQEAAVGAPPPPPPPGTGWRQALLEWATAQRAAVRRHPWVLRLPIVGPPATPNSVAWWEQGLAALEETPLDDGERISVIMMIAGFVRHEATTEADLHEAITSSGLGPDEVMSRYIRTLKRLADPERFPSVARVLGSGVMTVAGPPDFDFTFGMARILDGVEALIRAYEEDGAPVADPVAGPVTHPMAGPVADGNGPATEGTGPSAAEGCPERGA